MKSRGNRGFLTINGHTQRSAGHLIFDCITENGRYRQSVNDAGGEFTAPDKLY
jgi:hypothetical protein